MTIQNAIESAIRHAHPDEAEAVAKLNVTLAEMRLQARIDALALQAKEERAARVLPELDAIIAKRPWLNREYYTPRVLADETWLATLRSLPELPDHLTWDSETQTVRQKA